ARTHAELKGGRLERAPLERPHARLGEMRRDARDRLEGTVVEPHRLEDGALEVWIERFALRSLEDVTEDGDAGIRVLRLRPGLVDERRSIETGDCRGERWAGIIEVIADRRLSS